MNIKSKLQNTQNNWLIYTGGITFLFTITSGILYFIFNDDDSFSSSRDTLFKYDSITLFAIGATLFAPILEELSFRGFFTNKKWLVTTGSILLPLFIYSATNNLLAWSFLATIYSLFIWNYITPSKYKNIVLIILTSLLFAFSHYKFSDFVSISTYIGFSYKLFLATIAIWITQNFGITRSMLFHFCNNAIVVLLILISVQFPDNKKETFENSEIKVTWNRTPRFNTSDENMILTSETIKAKNTSFSDIYNGNIVFYNERKEALEVCPTEPFMRYNFNVTLKKKSTGDVGEIAKLFNNFLIKEKLVTLLPK